MSKKPKQDTTPTLALSSLHVRLEGLEKEHQKLLKSIKRKRTELNNFVEQMRSLAGEIFHRGSSAFQKLSEVDQEIHTLFNELINNTKFSKRNRQKIQDIYESLQFDGIITTRFDDEDEEDETELDELFESNDEEENSYQQNNSGFYQDEPDNSPKRSRTEETRKIRQIFLRLAEIFHPDKVTDDENHKHHTEIMKEINKAYQDGDLARLLEIEQQHQAGEKIDSNSEDEVNRKCRNMEDHNQILKMQYENLKHELRLVKNTPEGAMVSDYRKAVKQGIDPIGQMLESTQEQIEGLEEIRNFARDFQQQKITLKQFLEGPPSDDDDDDDDDMFGKTVIVLHF